MDYSPPGSSAHGNLQARILEWVAISFFGEYSQPKDQTHISCVSCIGRQIVYHRATGGKSLYNIVIWIWDWNRPGSNSSFATRYHGVLRVHCNLANRHNLLYPVEWCWHLRWDTKNLNGHKKERNSAICSNVDEPRDFYSQWNMSDRERQILDEIADVWDLRNDTNECVWKIETDSQT